MLDKVKAVQETSCVDKTVVNIPCISMRHASPLMLAALKASISGLLKHLELTETTQYFRTYEFYATLSHPFISIVLGCFA